MDAEYVIMGIIILCALSATFAPAIAGYLIGKRNDK